MNRGISKQIGRDRAIGSGKGPFNVDRRVYVLHAPLTSEEVTIQRRSNEPAAPTLQERQIFQEGKSSARKFAGSG